MDSSLPVWAKAGAVVVISYIALFLLGAIPGLASPFTRLDKIVVEASTRVDNQHENIRLQHEELLGVSRLICRGIWRGDEKMQSQCSGFPSLTGIVNRSDERIR